MDLDYVDFIFFSECSERIVPFFFNHFPLSLSDPNLKALEDRVTLEDWRLAPKIHKLFVSQLQFFIRNLLSQLVASQISDIVGRGLLAKNSAVHIWSGLKKSEFSDYTFAQLFVRPSTRCNNLL